MEETKKKIVKGTTLTTAELTKLLTEHKLFCEKCDDDTITLQGWGVSLVLHRNGAYYVTDITGG